MSEITNSRLKWISHRGYKESGVENTFEAFKGAIELGFTTLETDLSITSDNHIVLFHDHTLERLTGDPTPVMELTRKQLEEIALGNGERLLFFDQFAEEFDGCTWVLDLKPEEGNPSILALIDWVKKHKSEKWLEEKSQFVIWNKDQEKLLHTLIPGIKCYASQNECRRAGLSVLYKMPFLGGIKPNRTYALPSRYLFKSLYHKSFVEIYHRREASLLAYLPETDDDARAAIDAGFDEILTDGKIIED